MADGGFAPGRSVVHVWLARLDPDDSGLSALMAHLDDAERTRAAAIGSEVQQRRFVASRGILRELLAGVLACSPAAVRVLRPTDGKPVLACARDPAPVQFNVSHSDDLLAVALSRDLQVGVDVERVRVLWNVAGVARDVLAPEERAAFQAAPDPHEALLERWTAKEAVLKATGEGLTGEPASVVVQLEAGEAARLLRVGDDPEAHRRWSIKRFVPAPGYVGAVVAEGPNWTFRLRHWSPGRTDGSRKR